MNKERVLTVTLNPSLDKTIVLPELRVGSLNRTAGIRLDPGGKGINVARLLHEFGTGVTAAGWCGGAEGEELMRYLKRDGIPASFTSAVGATRTNLKIVDSSKELTTEINEPGPEVTEAELAAFIREFRVLLHDVSYLVLGGSIPPGVPPTVYALLTAIAHEHGVKTVLDADGEALSEGLQAVPFAVKPNIHELERLLGRTLASESEIAGAARELLGRGVSLVIVSMGESGSLVVGAEEAYRVTPFPITAKSTVGAGDSMVACLVYCLLQGKTLKEIAAWTSAAGTLTASKEGTQLCTLAEVQEQVHLVEVHPL
ncbi:MULTISPECIES: 1-phosphofructokinase [Paenibacillus]|uniref:1-phosphofructokinase n=1 Tax=Paenibacillus TaxID=44249 RepID=UPI0022B89216|nr:1-phosphofructokinase [Paenibacillus caseinilyticus]MCZ8522541.1 1-phosphofructokinase [Paenibacillus caseinilyticus]